MRHANLECRNPNFRTTGVRKRSAMVPSDKALISSYRLSLAEAVWPQFAMQVYGGSHVNGQKFSEEKTL